MELKKVKVTELKPGDKIFRGSICKIVAISPVPFMRGYGYDNHYYQALTVSIKCEALYDYDVAYAEESGRDPMWSKYDFDYTVDSEVYIVVSGETITKTSFSGIYCEKTGRYI